MKIVINHISNKQGRFLNSESPVIRVRLDNGKTAKWQYQSCSIVDSNDFPLWERSSGYINLNEKLLTVKGV